jgi:hypothetical protein
MFESIYSTPRRVLPVSMAKILSSMSNVEDDIHVCEVPNSLPDASPIIPLTIAPPIDQVNHPNEIPFEFLPGEQSIQVARDLVDGVICLTSYRLFTFCNQASHCSYKNCPLRLIESIEMTNSCLPFAWFSLHRRDVRRG